ncbi:ABC transporter ATP-binding protein [Micromonospora sp. DSM 115977]|uniref:ABC transporter ATP-binding protein n=1 Tax=Micromonospora reichwaldensis TaxID=3075516 RepID=A0ABU2WQS1_9ACTN|nr:ABC transporter ATP-binding protein [Micromonospora sp. DSM 115977]MDT0527915.1 ABC transporter ATP-binding protein [Micromonospora sp. DSM 115977]
MARDTASGGTAGTRTGATDPAADLLRVENLSVEFPAPSGGWQTTVQDVSFSLKPGESMALVGESGSGKTVTSIAVMGLTAATGGRIASGRVVFDGVDLTAGTPKQWRDLRGPGMGMIFQQPIRSLNPAYTVGDQIAESVRKHLGMNRRQARARAVEMLDMVQIPRAAQRVDEYPHAFSGGMCQRVMIAMVMACNPRLLIADEPTTALDVTVQERILELLRDLQEQTGVALLFVSHDLAVVAELCREVVVMYAGEVAENAPSEQLFFHPRHPYTSGLLGSIPKPGLSTDRRLRAIPGGIPSPGAWPHGCRFSSRCEYTQPGRCDVAHPGLVRVDGAAGHHARCVRVAELSLDGVTVG